MQVASPAQENKTWQGLSQKKTSGIVVPCKQSWITRSEVRMVLWTNTKQNSTCIADEENNISNLAKPPNLTCTCILFVCKWLTLFPSSHGAQTCHALLTMNPNKSNPKHNLILKRWLGELLWSAQYTTYCTSEAALNLQYNEHTLWNKRLAKFDPTYGWRRNAWKTTAWK